MPRGADIPLREKDIHSDKRRRRAAFLSRAAFVPTITQRSRGGSITSFGRKQQEPEGETSSSHKLSELVTTS